MSYTLKSKKEKMPLKGALTKVRNEIKRAKTI